MRKTAIFLATGAYTGLAPFAPGTAGSLLASLILLILPGFHHPGYAIAVFSVLGIGVWASAEAERFYQKEDAPQVVIDEIAGMMISVALLPAGWKTVAVAFVFFRIFDIAKPFPVRQAEHTGKLVGKLGYDSQRLFQLAGGVGVMMDDVVAGIYANIATRLVLTWMQ